MEAIEIIGTTMIRRCQLDNSVLNSGLNYRISAKSFRGNYSFFEFGNCRNIQIVAANLNFLHNKLNFCCGNYSRAETIRGNTVFRIQNIGLVADTC